MGPMQFDTRVELKGVEHAEPSIQLMDRGADSDTARSAINEYSRESIKFQQQSCVQAARHHFSPRNQLGDAATRIPFIPLDLKTNENGNCVARKSLPSLCTAKKLSGLHKAHDRASYGSSSIEKLEADFGKLEQEYLMFLQKAGRPEAVLTFGDKTARTQSEEVDVQVRAEVLSQKSTSNKQCSESIHLVKTSSASVDVKLKSTKEEAFSLATPALATSAKGRESAIRTLRSSYFLRGRVMCLEETTSQGQIKVEQMAKNTVGFSGDLGTPSILKRQPVGSSPVIARLPLLSKTSLSKGHAPRSAEMGTDVVGASGSESQSEQKPVIRCAKTSIGLQQDGTIGPRLIHSELKSGALGSTRLSLQAKDKSHGNNYQRSRSNLSIACESGSKPWR